MNYFSMTIEWNLSWKKILSVNNYMYVYCQKCQIYLYELQKQVEKQLLVELFCPICSNSK
jgi:hypothetical protein